MPVLEISGQPLSLEQIECVAQGSLGVALAAGARERLDGSRAIVERAVGEGRVVYGVNTGFGKLAGVHVPTSEIRELQLNLVRSHACGLGQPLPEAETRAMMLLRANTLALGYSGVRPALVDLLIAMIERRIHPVIPEKGSVGASGDLAPLAHLALTMIGEGEVTYQGERILAREALERARLQPLSLEAKEGLALVNGTQAMSAVGALALVRAIRLTLLADLAGAMTLEALRGTPAVFDERIQAVRPHPGQQAAAAHLRALMEESEIRRSHLVNDPRVQDAYSLRCMPQIHGAVRDALGHARRIFEIESGSATDNPLVFAETGEVLSGGNFHGAPLALALDYACLATTSLSTVVERRIARLVHPDLNEGLPPFLCAHPGVSSGFMLAHVVAVSLLNESKVLAHPATADNLPTSGDQEDHVSMGMTAALKFRTVVENAECILAIEILAASEGIEYRAPLRPAREIARALKVVRSLAPHLEADRSLAPDIERVSAAIRNGDFNEWASDSLPE